MSTARSRRLAPALFGVTLSALFVACASGDDGPDAEVADTIPAARAPARESAGPMAGPGVDRAEAQAVAAAAEPVAGALVQTLGSNLMNAMQDGGPVAAMEFCQVEALPLTRQVTEEQGMEVKRTSWRVRNPDNAPDPLEEAALAHFAEAARSGDDVPSPWVQAVPDGGYRYYKPLPTAALCLNCHGDADDLAEGVPEALAELYPRDEAVGFSEGELRGLLRVSVPATALTADAGDGG